jgi:hypothetical protein
VHPIERLRFVARASHVPHEVLAQEAAVALADFVGNDASLLIACQRILARQPTSAVMVWLVAHILGAPNQRKALWEAVETLESDPTSVQLADTLPDGATVAVAGWSDVVADVVRKRGDLGLVVVDIDGSADHFVDRLVDTGQRAFSVTPEGVGQAMSECTLLLCELVALGPEQVLATQGTLPAATVAQHWDIPVWAVASTGVALPGRMYEGLIRRWHESDRSPLWERPVEEFTADVVSSVVSPTGLVSLSEAIARSQCPIVPELF